MKNIICIALLFFLIFSQPLYSQTRVSSDISGGHRGNITSLIHKGETVLSAGEDGFLVTWNINRRAAIDRFQLTTYRIQSMVKHPLKEEVCIIEASGTGIYSLSVWNYSRKEKLFTIHSSSPLTYINYSASGNFIIAAGLDGFVLTLVNSSTGEINLDTLMPSGNTSIAVTGRAERNMLIYQSEYEDFDEASFEGRLIYFDLESNSVTGSFNAPGNLSSPVIFGNNRFLAGVNHDGLLLVDTTTGYVLDSMRDISRNSLLFPLSGEFFCVTQRGNSAVLYRFAPDRNGNLIVREQHSYSLPSPDNSGTISTIAFNESIVFASSNGALFTSGQANRMIPFVYSFQKRVTEFAAGENSIAFLTEDGQTGFIPLDFSRIGNSFVLEFTERKNFNRITSLSAQGRDHFILWQTLNTRTAPLLINSSGNEPVNLNYLTARFPLRAISVLNDKLLTLDTGGNITIRNTASLLSASSSHRPDFTFSSVGAIDAGFINNDYITICRSVIGNTSPFLSVNIRTGETIPYFFPVQAGLTAYPGRGGRIYAVAIEQIDFLRTVFMDLAAPAQQNRLFEYHGEALYYSITESNGRLVIACDNEGAMIISDRITFFERTGGLPVKLVSKGGHFICLDSEGNISWHDLNGKLLSVFSLRENTWTLKSNNREISGRIN